jgi:hypothetical protein
VPIASPIVRDLSVNGGGLAVVGIVGVVASSLAVSGGPARAIVPFLIVALVFGLAQVVVSGGWLRTAVADAALPPDGLVAEDGSGTFRRCVMPTVLAVVLVFLALVVWPQFAAMLSGLAFAAGMTDLRARQWIRTLQQEDDVVVMREVTPLPFSTSRKAIWAQPGPATAG